MIPAHSASLRAQRPAGRRQPRGFTLIEVMVVVAIVAILSAIAIPAYRDYVLRGKLVDATNLLATSRGNMERYFQDNRTYVDTGGFVAPCSTTVPAAQRRRGDNTNYFELTCTVRTGTAYTLLATGYGSLAGFTYTVDQSDTKGTTGLGAGWPVPSPSNCWVLKRGQTC